MADRQTREELIAAGEVVGAPVQRACTDQSFEFPNGIYAAMVFMFAAFIGVLGLAFRGGHMAVIVAVIFAFIAAFFAIPAIFPGVAARTRTSSARSWLDFRRRGIATATGHSTAHEATVLVLLLPSLVLCFGLAVVTIAAWVS